jgi:hypothetical protein
LGFTFSKITRVGARDVASDEKITAQQLRRYVHVVEVSAAMHLEVTVKAIVAYKYESFCNTSQATFLLSLPMQLEGLKLIAECPLVLASSLCHWYWQAADSFAK